MSDDIVNRNVHARSLVWRLYRDAADEDYIAARFFAKVDLRFNFFWSAQQALEKIVKATLLLNGKETAELGHDLSDAFTIAQDLSGDLLPIVLVPHSSFPNDARLYNYAQPASDFVRRIGTQGDANNRYRHYGVSFSFSDLYKLDQIYFTLRRTAFPLSMQEKRFGTYLEYLRKHRSAQLHKFECLSQSNRKKRGYSEKNTAFNWQNFAFCEEDALLNGSLSVGWSETTSPLYRAARAGTEGREALEWISEAAYFSRADRREIRDLIQNPNHARA